MNVAPVNPSPESQSLWYYADASNRAVGPLPFTDLQNLASEGVIQPETHVREKGRSEWKKFAAFIPAFTCAEAKPALATACIPSVAILAPESQEVWYYADAANQPVGPLPMDVLQRLAGVGVI